MHLPAQWLTGMPTSYGWPFEAAGRLLAITELTLDTMYITPRIQRCLCLTAATTKHSSLLSTAAVRIRHLFNGLAASNSNLVKHPLLCAGNTTDIRIPIFQRTQVSQRGRLSFYRWSVWASSGAWESSPAQKKKVLQPVVTRTHVLNDILNSGVNQPRK